MQVSPGIRARVAAAAATLAIAVGTPVAVTYGASPPSAAKRPSCNAVLRTLSPHQRHYVVAIASMTYTQLAAAFGTKEVNASTRPIDSCHD